ncbi:MULTISPECIES: OadG family transporter subunit [Desulfococcus]|uniref:Sodium pump decarboxylase gamma subunit n=1 Tax=Desulfococcus multivorans DSM 2059 TaxID=1121405 RepID=S7TD22_DESML|nr:OadG family transporter subunit [Desulfococcus multivorans]AOY57125.1 uncharacterized protein Dmul_03500 [Desulfococcus multivorans]AQU99624.1 hypothetical protein B2D07_01720 [Desulfococcus multivorans]EPR34455.1 sodium pump decarboxylase gamma subunit [Desulfococcus multivorans DSM 2059]MDX9819123.1 OadG family transporter subunit [Desulfococcus multivorans]SJZ87089.1 Oxaloacetate decarboxylase, gamma chain [Desulfococcus multivorans DSM 2059]
MRTIRSQSFHWLSRLVPAAAFLAFLAFLPGEPAAKINVSGDIEKPVPTFTREGAVIAAKLIPRAKSTSVILRFKAAGGKLASVAGVDFNKAARPEVDVKNFKSALFAIVLEAVPRGGEARVSVISDFFTRSTAFYVFNDRLPAPWSDSRAENISHPDRVQELVVAVQDGGPRDSDGTANGKITLVGGPRDSFWGYALGTLFIRFFGIFIVLSILMIGMILSGVFFQYLDRRKARREAAAAASEPAPEAAEPAAPETAPGIPETDAAAIAAALHLHSLACRTPPPTLTLTPGHSDAWTHDGLNRMMTDRLDTYNRTLHRKD